MSKLSSADEMFCIQHTIRQHALEPEYDPGHPGVIRTPPIHLDEARKLVSALCRDVPACMLYDGWDHEGVNTYRVYA